MEEKTTFGNFIKRKRKESGLSQKDLADRLYVTESAVSKWERGLSYPDITLVASICEALSITEHELITASEDFKQVELEKQAKGFQYIVKTYSRIFYACYAVSLLVCLICNLAIQHTVSWFFIVLTAELTAFSLCNVPVLVQKHKGPVTLGCFYASLNLLLLTCCLYTGGKWFGIAFISLLLGFAVIFLPLLLPALPLPEGLLRHKALLSLGVDTVLLFLLVITACRHNGYGAAELVRVIPVTAFCALLPWLYLAVIRYSKWNGLFKASACVLATGFYTFSINMVLNSLLHSKPCQLPPISLTNWGELYLDGNIRFLTLLLCIAGSLLFTAGGVALQLKKSRKSSPENRL